MASKAVYIDSFSYGTMHEQYNSAMFLSCSYVFDDIIYCVGKDSYKHTSKLIDLIHNKDYKKKIIYVSGLNNSRLALFIRLIISSLQNIRLLFYFNKEYVLIYNFNNFISLFIVNSINKVLNKKILIVCHSELAFLVNKSVSKNIIYKLRTKILRYFFLEQKFKIANNLFFLVLSDSIKKNLQSIIPKEKLAHFISIDHPYIFKSKLPLHEHKDLKIGIIGTMAQEKGADILIEIAKKLDLLNRKDISILIIGRILCDFKIFQEEGIGLPDDLGQSFLNRDEFNEKISSLDYVLYLYPVNTYKYTASGSLMDSINIERPIISFKNDYFKYIFDKFGQLGFLVNDTHEMILLIEELLVCRSASIDIQFSKIKEKLSPLSIKDHFRTELIKNKII